MIALLAMGKSIHSKNQNKKRQQKHRLKAGITPEKTKSSVRRSRKIKKRKAFRA